MISLLLEEAVEAFLTYFPFDALISLERAPWLRGAPRRHSSLSGILLENNGRFRTSRNDKIANPNLTQAPLTSFS